MFNSIPDLLFTRADESPNSVIQYSKDANGKFLPTTYQEFKKKVLTLSDSFLKLGLKKGDKVFFLSDNRSEWLLTDIALLYIGAIDVPRGRDTTIQEIEYIESVIKADTLIVENEELLKKVLVAIKDFDFIKRIILFDKVSLESNIKLINFSNLFNNGSFINAPVKPNANSDDIATIIFTSGTTGKAKGVMITHNNLLSQLPSIHKVAPFKKDQIWLSVLPVWHAFERILQYLAIYEIEAIAYSKPIGKIMLTDITRINPHYLGSVPRIWETIKDGVDQSLKNKSRVERKLFYFFLSLSKRYCHYKNILRGLYPSYRSKVLSVFPFLLYSPLHFIGQKFVFSQVREKLGKNYIGGISGGGSLSKDIQEYFEALGIVLLDGYGLTELSPVVATGIFKKTIVGYIKPLDITSFKIINEDGKEAGINEKGEIIVKGPQVMKGYYLNEEATNLAIDKDGYFHTGDLAIKNSAGWFKIVGRKKDTIVLKGGENIEPTPIENKIILSEYIESAVVVGQDKKYLAALIVPNYKNVERYLKTNGISYLSRDSLVEMAEVKNLIQREINDRVNRKEGFKSYEEIIKVNLLKNSFTIGKELSLKQEIKRNEILKLYEKEIEEIYL